MMQLCFGKKPAREGAIKLKFADYVDKAALPKHPLGDFGHDNLFPEDCYGMLGNDQYGCCFWAGSAHETMVWNKLAGRNVSFTTANVLGDYGSATGFNASKPGTDGGTDMGEGAKYRQTVGIIDSTGKRHTVVASLALRAGDLEEHLTALYLFNVVGLGIMVPSCFVDQFNAGKPWDVSSDPGPMEGGHYIPLLARRGGALKVITWGKNQPFTPKAFGQYNDESVVYLTEENLVNRKSPEGFDYDSLVADIKNPALTA